MFSTINLGVQLVYIGELRGYNEWINQLIEKFGPNFTPDQLKDETRTEHFIRQAVVTGMERALGLTPEDFRDYLNKYNLARHGLPEKHDLKKTA